MKKDEKMHPLEMLKRLRTGETPKCPAFGEGIVSTEYDPKISHFFRCNNCDFMINIDPMPRKISK